ncbi:MAG: DEAD/DEAH box helicase family protein [Alphaproteobacteria bacterium]|jgi:N12 class adenine-specific DNA methylase|nr:DEAD/DEAH box helicase family protein [Alphaproteobacteria bacterium]
MKKKTVEQINFLAELDLREEKEDGRVSRKGDSEQQSVRAMGNQDMESLEYQQSQRARVHDDGSESDRFISNNPRASGSRERDVATGHEPSRFSGIDGNQLTSNYGDKRYSDIQLEVEKLKENLNKNPNKEVYSLSEEDTSSFFLNKKIKTENSIAAIKLAKELKANRLNPTREEQSIIAKYIGFGGVPQLFNEENAEYQKLRESLKSIVSKKEYDSLRDSTSDTFYTNDILIKSIYKILDKAGYLDKKGLDILEPSCGSGNFIGLMPQQFRDNNKIYGVELNPISALISKHLYASDNIKIKNKPYQEIDHNINKFDIVVGNFPFGNQIIYDQYSSLASGKNLHNYFLTKSIESLNHKGILVAITSSQFLNQKSNIVKQDIDGIADFIGAIRLPESAFKNADTEALCDIVIFQKNNEKVINKEVYKDEDHWINKDFTSNLNINVLEKDYFVRRIGKPSVEKDRYGKYFTNFSEDFNNIEPQLEQIIKGYITNIGRDFIKQKIEKPKNIIHYPVDKDIFIGEYLITHENKVAIRVEDDMEGSRVELIENNIQKYKDFINLKQSVKDLLNAEVNNQDEKEIFELRKELNTEYIEFTQKYGNLQDKNNKSLILEDIRGRLVLELENKDKQGNITKASIFTKRLISNKKAVINSVEDALYYSVSQNGVVDINYIANLKELNFAGDEAKVIKCLEGMNLAYYNPKADNWEIKEQYLSGNVLEKLEELRNYPELIRNKTALEKVIPKNINIADIGLDMTASWIPQEFKKSFIDNLFNIEGCLERFEYVSITASYDIKIKGYIIPNSLNTKEYGTDRISATEIITKLFKKQNIEVKDRFLIENQYIYKLNHLETELALNKAELIQDKFQEYVLSHPHIAKEIEEIYNKTFNNYVAPNYKGGESLNLSNSNDGIILRPHQKRAMLRGILEDRYLLDHAVGAGKTYTMIATIMERKRLGFANKPMLVVPNHIVGQWRDSFKELYPNSNILCADESNFSKDKRESFLSKVALNNWDCVIISHSAFEKISLTQEYVKQHILRELEVIDGVLSESDDSSFTVKHLKKVKEAYSSKLESMVNESKKDKVLSFDNLSIDELYVDEAHEFKNLQFHTKQGDIRGINPKGSNKAYDLYMKCQYIQEQKVLKTGKNNKGVFFATGTPISNSLAELYTISRYLDGNTLAEKGINHFDEWCNTFAEVKEEWQVATTGNGFEKRKMFSSFKNIPELSKMYLQYGDIILNNDIKDYIKLPGIQNNKPNNIALNPTEEQKDFMNEIISRMERIKSGLVDPRDDNHLKICTDARKASVDMRVVNENYEFCEKTVEITNNIVSLYNQWNEDRGTQLVFLDISTPKDKSDTTFSLYNDMKQRLINKGIKQEEIAFIHDYKKDEDKLKLFKAINSGEIRVLLGSSQKMGAGMNVQERLVGLHHVDAPWRPTDLEQREGRIIRQGNKLLEKYGDSFKIIINRYSTKYTYDTRLWQILENKAKFINDFKKGNIQVRSGEDIGNTEVKSAEEMKAIASGNPYLLLHLKLESEYKKKNNIYLRDLSDRKLMELSIKQYESGTHENINKLNDTITKYENTLTEDRFDFKLETEYRGSRNMFVFYEANTNIYLYREEFKPTDLQVQNRIEKFPEILSKELESLKNNKQIIINDIITAKELLNKPLDNKEITILKEDLDKCKEILNKMNLTSQSIDIKESPESSQLYFIPKSKGFDKEITEINKFFGKNNERLKAKDILK